MFLFFIIQGVVDYFVLRILCEVDVGMKGAGLLGVGMGPGANGNGNGSFT